MLVLDTCFINTDRPYPSSIFESMKVSCWILYNTGEKISFIAHSISVVLLAVATRVTTAK